VNRKNVGITDSGLICVEAQDLSEGLKKATGYSVVVQVSNLIPPKFEPRHNWYVSPLSCSNRGYPFMVIKLS
jgi:hypothetical protein